MSRAEARWEAGEEPGRQVVALGLAVALTALTLDLLMVGEVSLFFDLCFIALCLALAVLVRPRDFIVVAVLPPALMVAVFTVLALAQPEAVADPGDNAVQAVVSGVALHSAALVAGYAVCLAWLGHRLRTLTGAGPHG